MLRLTLLFLFCNLNFTCISQLTDSSVVYYKNSQNNGVPNPDVRHILISTTSGPSLISQTSNDDGVTWNPGNGSPSEFRITIDQRDQLLRLSVRTFKSRTTADWIDDSRFILSYDSIGNISDTLFQNYVNHNWIDTVKHSFIYTDSLYTEWRQLWDGNQWTNIFKKEFWFTTSGMDSIKIFYTGNGTQWESDKRILYQYNFPDTLDEILSQTWNSTSWENEYLESFTYDSAPDYINRTFQQWNNTQWDTLKIYTDHYSSGTIDSTYIVTSLPFIADTLLVFDNNQIEIYFFDGSGWNWVSTTSYNAHGDITSYSYDGDAGSSAGSGGYQYNSSHELTYQWYNATSLGGFTMSGNETHTRNLVNYFNYDTLLGCINDTFFIDQITYGGIPPYAFTWTSSGYISNSTIAQPRISATTSTSFYLKITDASGNVFHDSLRIVILSLPTIELGNDTTICINSNLNLAADTGFSTYHWSNGSTNSYTNVSSSVPGTNLYHLTVTDSLGCTVSDSILITFDPCLGLQELEHMETAYAFPNPAPASFTIKLTHANSQVDIFNSTGQFLLRKYSVNDTLKIQDGELSPGTYYIRANAAESFDFYKIIIQ